MGQLSVTKSEPLTVVKSETGQPAAAAPPAERPWYAPVTDLVSQLQSLNPVAVVKGVATTVSDLPGTVRGMGQQNAALFQKAEESFKAGDYATGTRHLASYLLNGIPGLGQRLDEAADDFQQGEYAKGMGKTLDASIATMGPAAVTRVRGAHVPGLGGSALNAAEREAVAFGESRGVPIDAATGTGRPVVATGQKWASDTPGGARRAEQFQSRQTDALTRVGGELSDQAHPTAIDPVRAGEGVRDAVRGRISQLHKDATAAYDSLRALEQKQQQIINQHGAIQAPNTSPKPFTTVPLAVDVAPAKAALQPLYQQLMREKELVGVLQGGKARTLTALDALLGGPDLAPLSVVDGALGDLKAMARGAEMPELRTGGQAAAAEAVKQLDIQVRARAAQAGPNVIKALEDGRKATVQKYQAADVLDTFSTEPRKIFDMLTTRKDGAIEKLKAVKREAPGELPKIGRAYLEEMMQKATAEGGFDNAGTLFSEWQKLGPDTKALIFNDPVLVKNIGDFLLLAKRMKQNVNPSGTARVSSFFTLSATVPAYAMAKLFYTPKGVSLLRRGLTIQAGNKTATAAYAAELSRAVDEAAQLAPAGAQDQNRRPRQP